MQVTDNNIQTVGGGGGEGRFQAPPAMEAGQTKAKEGQDQAQIVDGNRAVPL